MHHADPTGLIYSALVLMLSTPREGGARYFDLVSPPSVTSSITYTKELQQQLCAILLKGLFTYRTNTENGAEYFCYFYVKLVLL